MPPLCPPTGIPPKDSIDIAPLPERYRYEQDRRIVADATEQYQRPVGELRQRGYEILSARIQWQDPSQRFTAALYGDNLTNNRHLDQVISNTIGTGAGWNSPVTYGVSAWSEALAPAALIRRLKERAMVAAGFSGLAVTIPRLIGCLLRCIASHLAQQARGHWPLPSTRRGAR